jgi:hypothetical protein
MARPAGPPGLGSPEGFAQLSAQLYAKEGGVDAKAPLAGPAHVFYGGLRPLPWGACVPHRSMSVHIGGLDPVRAPLRLPLPLPVAAESLRPS